jgi:hypothetical protein
MRDSPLSSRIADQPRDAADAETCHDATANAHWSHEETRRDVAQAIGDNDFIPTNGRVTQRDA